MPVPHRATPPERVGTAPAGPATSDMLVRDDHRGSPVHALQARIGEAWQAEAEPGVKQICLSRLALIGALGLAAWVPVAAAAALLAR